MAEGGRVSLAQLKRDLDSLSQQIFQIDLKIQQLDNKIILSTFQTLRLQKRLQQQILQKQIALEWQQAQNKRHGARWVSWGDQGQSLPGPMYWESRSMKCLTGQLIVYIQYSGWPGEGLLADKSSTALNKQIDTI